jgi:hypothetical protein
MPHRLVCLAILLFWSIAAGALFTRDLLPDLMIGTPPDLRTISRGQQSSKPTRWAIQVAEDPALLNLRLVGQAETKSALQADGWMWMTSNVVIDAADLLKGGRFQTSHEERLEVLSTYEIDPSGNLFAFRASVRAAEQPDDLMVLEGKVKGDTLEVQARGPLPIFNWGPRTLPYQARGMVQNTLGPMDRMPGLQVGQRWESRIISPLTGRVETVRFEVARKAVITWGNSPVAALEVVARATPLSIRIWVRPDGVVLRQEVPFPFVRLVLDRLPEDGEAAVAKVGAP